MYQNNNDLMNLDRRLIDWAKLLPLEIVDIIISYLPLEIQHEYYAQQQNNRQTEDYKNRLLIYLAIQLESKQLFLRPTHQILFSMKIPSNYIQYKNRRLIKKKRLQNVVIYSASITAIGDEFLQDYDSLTSVWFIFPNLKTIGNYWMRDCVELRSIDFTGLPYLHRVGNDWMKNCDKLQSIGFTGLHSLKRVGHRWMNFCDHLLTVDFEGLSSLRYVGIGWISHCKELRTINMTGLLSILSVGNYWMGGCTKLEFIDMTGGGLGSS